MSVMDLIESLSNGSGENHTEGKTSQDQACERVPDAGTCHVNVETDECNEVRAVCPRVSIKVELLSCRGSTM